MILNQAENIMSGADEVSKVYCGINLIWSRIPPVVPVSNFELDVTRFAANDPKVYDTNGKKIGQIIEIGGNVSDCKTVNDGLEVSGSTSMRIPVNLPKNSPWTIIYCIKAFNNSGEVEFIFDSKNEELASYKNNSIYGIKHSLGATQLGNNYTLLNNAYTYTSEDIQLGIWDEATRTSEMLYYNMDYRWICNGTTLSLYVNGVKKIETSLEHFPNNIEELGIPVYNNNDDSNNSRMIITKLQVVNSAVATPSHVVYKWNITDFRGYDTYFQFARLRLYSDGARIDEEAGCVAACWVDAQKPTYTSDNETVKVLTGDRNGKLCAERGAEEQNIYFSVPYELDAVDSYSYVTANDYADRDPTSWELYKSVDGCVTWRLLDTQSNISDPGRGNETDIFPITNPDPPAVDPEPPIPETTISRMSGQPPFTFPADGSNLLDWEIKGAEDSTTGVAVGIPYTNLFYNHQWENYYRNYTIQGVIDEKSQKDYYVSTYDVIPVEPETDYTLAFYNGSVTDYRYFYFIWFDNTVSNTVEPTQVPQGERSPYIASTSKYLGLNGKSYATVTSPANAAYVRIVVGNTSDSSINSTNVGDTMFNKGKYPFPYIADNSTKYAVPVVVTSGNDTYYHVFSLSAPLSTGDVISKTSTGVNIPTYSGTNVLTVDTPTLPQMNIKYKNAPPKNYLTVSTWLTAVNSHVVSAYGQTYTGMVGGTITPVTGGFTITVDGLVQTSVTLSADYPANGYAVPIAVEQGQRYTLSWNQDNARPNTYVYIFNGREGVANTQISTQQYLTFTAPNSTVCLAFQFVYADTEPQKSVTFTNILLRKD